MDKEGAIDNWLIVAGEALSIAPASLDYFPRILYFV